MKRYTIMFHGTRKDGQHCSGCGQTFQDEERAEYLSREMEKLTKVPHFVAETEGK